MSESNSTFKTLASISVKEKTERKGNMDYLSWANAWSMLKQNYPDAQRVVYEDPATGLNFYTDGRTAYVKVGIIVGGLEHIDYLPVMDYKNNAVPIEKVTSFDVNKTIQRSTAKAIALHGLGLSLWSGEDIAETASAPAAKDDSWTTYTLEMGDANWDKVIAYISANKELGLPSIVKNLETKYKITSSVKKELAKHVK
jgi:hypothetical protein